MEAEARHDLLRLGWRGAWFSRFHGMGRNSRRRFNKTRGRLHQFGFERQRLLIHGRLPLAREIYQWRGPRYSGPGNKAQRLETETTARNPYDRIGSCA